LDLFKKKILLLLIRFQVFNAKQVLSNILYRVSKRYCFKPKLKRIKSVKKREISSRKMKNIRTALKKSRSPLRENLSVKFSKEEIELIKKGLHLEEMSICEILNDDLIKYQHQLSVIKNLYKKLDVA
jgi:hypothetical protein